MASYQGWDVEEMKAARAAEDDMEREPKRTYLGLDDESAAQPPDEAHHAITGIEAVAKAAVRKRASRSKQKVNTKRPVPDGTRATKPRKKATHEAVTSDVIDFAYQPPRELESRHVNVPSSRSPFPDDVQAKGVGYTLSKRIISELDASRPQSLSTPGSYGDKLESEVLEVIEELPEEESPTPRKFKPGLRSTQNPAGLVQSYSEARGLDVPCFEPATASGSTELDDFDADVDDEELIRLAARCHTPDLRDAESLPDLSSEPCDSREQGTIQQLPTPLPSSSFARGVPIPAACDDPMEWTALIDSDDAEFLGLTQDLEVNPPTLEQHSATEPAKAVSKRQMRVYSPKSSSTPFSASPANETRTQLDGDDAFRPIVRPPFPCQVQDRSPIVGLSATSVLRTCFRAGEALNVGCQAVREGRTIIIELYATVRSSFRESDSVKQHFVIGDLFHDRPPYINAVYELWKGVDLWDYDSSPFLEQSDAKRMCRCIGKMKREDRKWKLLVLNIWEASWEDIDYVKGIICA
ncbi:hypothetical protein H2201_006463 [Coniosporium apollinis]|uniref:Chromo domain-containing protein n=1 Tax=Coniosporium apollinis TaxID=61459 RepID=A0ABQ9NTL4_9PEZI|nr:hypothetical protein H2201_006463 [Coniosporium apollinis]